jgi:hypothetical protein
MVGLCAQQCSQDPSASIPDLVDFNFDVKPILVQKCYLCHGPDSTGRKGGVRLDTYAGATAALKHGGKAIVPGHIDSSKLIERIHHTDPDMVMPPLESRLKLNDKEIAILTKWIKQGAEWKPHWAFIPPLSPDLSGLSKDQNAIDYFIGQRIKTAGLQAAGQANKNTLIRRVSYMLTGLPPSVESIDQYLTDNTPEAYEKMVDQYLHSNRFGEKWARHWMDVVRYAETKGHEFDYVIAGAWRYRDYLIRAFNQDIPYNQFVKEQLAGDLMTNVRRDPINGNDESHLGTVFYTMYEGTHSPVDVRKDESDRIDNMIDVTTKTFQGLTVACARCHDHKFDPILTKDYYALYGIMESSRFSPVPATCSEKEEQSIIKVNEIKTYVRRLIADQWMREITNSPNESIVFLKNVQPKKTEESGYKLIGDFRDIGIKDWKSDGHAFSQHTTLGDPLVDSSGNFTGLDEGKASSRILGTGIFGALRSPNFLIEKDFIGVRAKGAKATIRIIVDNFQLISYPIFGGLDQKVDTPAWKNFQFDVTLWKGHKAYIEILPGTFNTHVYNLPQGAFVEIQYSTAFDRHWITPPLPSDQSPMNPKAAIEHWSAFKASPQETVFLNRMLKAKLLSKKIEGIGELIAQGKQLTRLLKDSIFYNGIYDGYAINSHVFRRGNHLDETDLAPRKFITAIAKTDVPYQSTGSGRMELAESILDPKNPLTARVMVNRIWHHLFGRGIVETTDNFGLQGKLPSHPELLDFLAIKFQHDGWSVRKIIRYIMLSNTFKRAIQGDMKSVEVDPEDLLLTHYPMRRLEAEEIRDGLLAVSGRLDSTMYGPPIPCYITSFMQGRGRPKNSGPLDGNGRRSVYQEVRRNFLEPMMVTFDRPIPFSTFGKRNVSNVPAQSLIMMNDPFVLQQAEEMACLVTSGNLTADKRIETIYKRAFARPPTIKEKTDAKSFLQTLASQYKVNGHDANAILSNLDIWRDYCHIIFNSKEFIYLS